MEDGRGDNFLLVRRLCSWVFMEDGRWDSILWMQQAVQMYHILNFESCLLNYSSPPPLLLPVVTLVATPGTGCPSIEGGLCPCSADHPVTPSVRGECLYSSV
ncbi:hypothetical protein CFC21_097880 [Triticum aestivum]|uniref:Uncharacterized protein n=3 Tax=Triticum TaxID=4564 RepID=A0A9R0ZC15_TRITD|nr:hypothetical protein CFC21_097880 [Triticum aestivum]VAI75191.1 unnamed protein product [Triticum turgidum subsp. durum]